MVIMTIDALRKMVTKNKAGSYADMRRLVKSYENWFAFDGTTGEIWIVRAAELQDAGGDER